MDEMLEYTITVRVPSDERDTFLATITGDDDCCILAAEKAIRARVDDWECNDEDWRGSGIELEAERGVYVRH